MNKSVSIHWRMSRWGYFKNDAQEIKFQERQFTELVWSALSAPEKKKLPQVIIALVNHLRNTTHHCFSENNWINVGNISMPYTEHTSRTLFLNARLSSVSDSLLWLSADSSVGWKWNDSGSSLNWSSACEYFSRTAIWSQPYWIATSLERNINTSLQRFYFFNGVCRKITTCQFLVKYILQIWTHGRFRLVCIEI